MATTKNNSINDSRYIILCYELYFLFSFIISVNLFLLCRRDSILFSMSYLNIKKRENRIVKVVIDSSNSFTKAKKYFPHDPFCP